MDLTYYHYTCLFKEEKEFIEQNGLKVFNEELVDFKLDCLKNYCSNEIVSFVKEKVEEQLLEENYDDRYDRVNLTDDKNINSYENCLYWFGDILFSSIYDYIEDNITEENKKIGDKIKEITDVYEICLKIPEEDVNNNNNKFYKMKDIILNSTNYKGVGIYSLKNIDCKYIYSIKKIERFE